MHESESTSATSVQLREHLERLITQIVERLRGIDQRFDRHDDTLANISDRTARGETFAIERTHRLDQFEARLLRYEEQRAVIVNKNEELHAAINTRHAGMTARVAALEESHRAFREQVALELKAGKEAVSMALTSAKEAVSKAETAAEKRFEAVNEFRASLGDQQRNLMPRSEVEVLIRGINDKLNSIQSEVIEKRGLKSGTQQGWVLAVGVVGFIVTVLLLLNLIMSYRATP